MEKIKKLSFLFFAAIIAVVGFSSCDDEDDPIPAPAPTATIAEVASGESSTSILVQAVSKFPDLLDALSSNSSEYTVFAPTDEAFTSFLSAIGQSSLDDIPESVLRRVLEYHVIGGATVLSTDLIDGQEANTLLDETISISTTSGVVINGSATVTTADVASSNGVIHIIDAVLIPQLEAQIAGTIVAPAYFNNDFTTLIAAVLAADEDILSVLLGDGPSGNGMTLFAPNNAAFEAAGITELPDGATLSAVLKYHVVDATVFAADLPSTSGAATAIGTLGGDFYLSNPGSGVSINGKISVTATDIEGSNGVVHLIDETLLPPSQNVVEIAVAAGFSKLAEALTEANLVDALSAEGDFTVFAPTDDAFDALYAALGVSGPAEIDDATLEAVLLYHVASGARVFSSDLVDQASVTGLGDASFTINVGESAVTIEDNDPDNEDSQITQTNILGTNGVIHVINSVILPVDI